jgi:hypothetical protein
LDYIKDIFLVCKSIEVNDKYVSKICSLREFNHRKIPLKSELIKLMIDKKMNRKFMFDIGDNFGDLLILGFKCIIL